MPYFVYKVLSPSRLTWIETKDRYKDARTLVRRLRQEQPSDDEAQFRMIFASGTAEAEKLLSRPRDERVIGED
jgi:GH24 family phage-related lysozyme (muramidase)